MQHNTIAEMKEILDAIEQGKAIQFTYGGCTNWLDADKFINPCSPDFMHNKYRIKPEEPKKKWRPFKDVDEFINAAGGLGAIWLKSKYDGQLELVNIIDVADKGNPLHLHDWHSLTNLLNNYTFLDGTPCGVEE